MFDGTEGCSVIFRYCLALLMDRLLSWTAMAECWPMCSFTSQMASSACPGTTPASWWRTAARATRTPMTIPHRKVVLCAHPSVSALQVLMKTSRMPGSCHAVLKQQDGHRFMLMEAKRWCVPVEVAWGMEQRAGTGEFLALPPASLAALLAASHTSSVCTNEIMPQSSMFSVRVSEKCLMGTYQVSLMSRCEVLQWFTCMEVVRVQSQKLMC